MKNAFKEGWRAGYAECCAAGYKPEGVESAIDKDWIKSRAFDLIRPKEMEKTRKGAPSCYGVEYGGHASCLGCRYHESCDLPIGQEST